MTGTLGLAVGPTCLAPHAVPQSVEKGWFDSNETNDGSAAWRYHTQSPAHGRMHCGNHKKNWS